MSDVSMDVSEVCVVGAGLSGLLCALELARQGCKVAVLEAAAEVGGRVLAEEVTVEGSKRFVELGASYCSREHGQLLALCEQFGAEVHPLELGRGSDLWSIRGNVKRRPAKGFPGKSLDKLLRKVEEDSAYINVANPTHSPVGAHADLTSAAGALPTEDLHAALWLEGAVADIFGCTGKDLSYLQLLCAAQDVPLDLLTEVRLSNLHQMCKNIAAQIQAAGGAVYRSSRVSTIHQTQLTSQKNAPITPPPSLGRRPSVPGAASAINKDYPVRVTAETPSGRRIIDAKYVVMAVPLHALRRIEFLPAIPPHLAIPLSRAYGSVAIKATVMYARDFWRRKGLTGEVWADGQQGPLTRVRDVSGACKTGQGALETVIIGDNAYHLLQQSAEEREQMIVSNLEQWFGYEAKSLKIMYQERVWEGATIFPTGVLTDCATAFNEPFGRVLFASSDTAMRNRGVLEGAVHAGRDAAAAARALLTGQPLQPPRLTKSRRSGTSNWLFILGALLLMIVGALFMSGGLKIAADLYQSYLAYEENRSKQGDCTGGNPLFG